MKKIFVCLAGLLFASTLAFSQIVTASSYFNEVSDLYAGLYSYRCDIAVDSDGTSMKGKVAYSRPQLVRVDFTSPSGQMFLFDGSMVQIYLPRQEIILQQNLTEKDVDDNEISARGLTLFKRYYSIAFEKDATPVPLDSDSDKKVVNLMLHRRATTESFETIRMSIDAESKLILRVIATTARGKTYRFDLSNYNLNANVSSKSFYFEAPSHITAFNNFMFQE